MNKRGAHTLVGTVFVTLLSVLLIPFFYNQLIAETLKIQDTTLFETKFLAEDLPSVGVAMEAMNPSVANMVAVYDKDTKWFSFEVKQGSLGIQVHDETATLGRKLIHPMALRKETIVEEVKLPAEFSTPSGERKSREHLVKKIVPVFAKIQHGLHVSNLEDPLEVDLATIPCSKGSFPIDAVLIDAGHGGFVNGVEDKGYEANGVEEKDITAGIGSFLASSLLLEDSLLTSYTRKEFIGLLEDQKRKPETVVTLLRGHPDLDLIIGFHAGNYVGRDASAEGNMIKAYILEGQGDAQTRSRQFACSVLNELVKVEVLGITGVSINALPQDQYHGMGILRDDIAGVVFEIGNVQDSSSLALVQALDGVQALSDVIVNAILEGSP